MSYVAIYNYDVFKMQKIRKLNNFNYMAHIRLKIKSSAGFCRVTDF